jgi:hypothetical protein
MHYVRKSSIISIHDNYKVVGVIRRSYFNGLLTLAGYHRPSRGKSLHSYTPLS